MFVRKLKKSRKLNKAKGRREGQRERGMEGGRERDVMGRVKP